MWLLLSPQMKKKPRLTARIKVERRHLSTTLEGFVCAAIDWWPPTKCDSGRCSWGATGSPVSVLTLNFSHPVLRAAVRELVGDQVAPRTP